MRMNMSNTPNLLQPLLFGLLFLLSRSLNPGTIGAQVTFDVEQIDNGIRFTIENVDHNSPWSIFYSTDTGEKWREIGNQNVRHIQSKKDGAIVLHWAVLEEFEDFVEEAVLFKLLSNECDPIQYHGNKYSVVQLGRNCWFAENLKTSRYRNGDLIPGEFTNNEWIKLNTGAQSVYNNRATNLDKYGRLYNWFAVSDERGICPTNWHVSWVWDWDCLDEGLIQLFGGEANAGRALKAKSTDSPAWNGENTSGFSALPSGYRDYQHGVCFYEGEEAAWWSRSSYDMSIGFAIWAEGRNNDVYTLELDYRNGFAVRCVMDDFMRFPKNMLVTD